MRIKKNDILTIDKYIYEALYNSKSGYYMKSNPFGKNGDYITAPNISILFSEMIAIWIILFWENLKRPNKFNEVLDNFGKSDITYNLSFKLVEKILKKFNLKIGGMTNQKNFQNFKK